MNANKATILLIEDEKSFRNIYRDVLESDGYKVLEAEDGEKGYSLARTEKPNLVLLDVILPKLSGFEVLKKIRSDLVIKDMPVIIFSVLGDKDTINKGFDLGANDYTVKGFYTPREILGKISTVLASSIIHKKLNTYLVALTDNKSDSIKLQQDIGMTRSFQCDHCHETMMLELIPDYTRAEGHWFASHFVCPKCKISF